MSTISSKKRKDKIIITRYKIIYTFLILSIYLFGRCIPLSGIICDMTSNRDINTQTILLQSIGGDINQVSIFAIGISPYMISSMFVQVLVTYKKASSKSKISPKNTNIATLAVTFLLALMQAVLHVRDLHFTATGDALLISKCLVVMEMVTGVMMIMWLAVRNKRYGIGGQTALIFINILDGITSNLVNHKLRMLLLPAIFSIVVIVVVVIMENTEKRIPVQRISIHNIYGDKNYLAIKLNPIGIMPVMFSTAFFMVPQLIIKGMLSFFPHSYKLNWLNNNISLSKPLGIIVYCVVLYSLTEIFSIVFLNPRELTEHFLKNGDSILNLHAGKDTKRYLSKVIRRLSFVSATVMCVCIGVPMVLQYYDLFDNSLIMLPSSIMMLTGIWCNLYQEYVAIKKFEEYTPFI